MALDLSFIERREPGQQRPQAGEPEPLTAGGLDLSFATKVPTMTPAETATAISEAQDAGEFPQGARDGAEPFLRRVANMVTTDKVGTMFTGDDRETNATRNLPELGSEASLQSFLGPDRFNTVSSWLGGAKKAAALLTSIDPAESVRILSEAAPGLSVRSDEAGNIILGLDGKDVILNKPGMTGKDWLQMGGLTAAFMPSERAARGVSLLGDALRVGGTAGATQAGIEALQSSEGGEFNAGDVAATAAIGGGAQAALQKLAQKLFPSLSTQGGIDVVTPEMRERIIGAAIATGMKADDVTDDMILRALNRAGDAGADRATPRQILAMDGEREFQIPLTKGQRTGSQKQLSFEDSARSGMFGGKPQDTVLGWERATQRPAINRAVDQFEGRIAGDVSGSTGGIIREGVRAAERAADEAVGAAYDAVPQAALTPDGLQNVLKNTRLAVRGMEFDRTLPETSKVLNLVKGYEKTLKTMSKGIKPVDMQRLEFMRRRLNTHVGSADGADKRQLTIMKRAFDDSVDEAIQNGLFTGDEATITALKEARTLFRDYVGKFRQNPQKGRSGRIVDQDAPGKFIERLVEANPTDEQIVNEIFGANGVSKGAGRFMAERYKDILGDDSEGWKAIRKEAVRRIFQTTKFDGQEVISGAKTQSALDKALEKNGSLMNTLFSGDELSEMRRLVAAIKRTQPDLVRSRENPSGTAQKAAKGMQEMLRRFSTTMGFAGEPMLMTAGAGIQAASGMTKAGKAAAAIRPFEQLRRVKPGVVSGATSGIRYEQEN